MKKKLKKSLVLLSAGMLILNSGPMPINSRVLAVNPPKKSSRDLKEGEFKGDDGTIYKLGEFMGRGDQAMVYRCFDPDGHKYVVKIPINEFLDKEFDENGQPKREDVLDILQKSLSPTSLVSSSDGEVFVPPARPTKAKPTSRLGLSRLRRLSFEESDDAAAAAAPTRASEDEDNDEGDEISMFDDDDDADVQVAKSASAHRIEGDKEQQPGQKPSKRICLDTCSTTSAAASSDASTQSSSTAAQLPAPNAAYLRETVMDPKVARVLWHHPVRYAALQRSNCPQIESDLGMTLEKYTAENQLPKAPDRFNSFVVNTINHVLMPLAHYHGLGMCHRDVKLENIFINLSGIVCLGDPGAMCFFNDCIGNPVGTPGYMAPEVWNQYFTDASQVPKSDVFSLGIVTLELLSDDFLATNRGQTEEYYKERNKDMLRYLGNYHMRIGGGPIPENWQKFLVGCLNDDPAKRLTAREAQKMLRDLFGEYIFRKY